HYLNLWGEDPSLLDNESIVTVTPINLSGGTIGHGEVTDWYQDEVVAPGLTFSAQPPPGSGNPSFPPAGQALRNREIIVHSPVALLILSPDGRRLGYNPNTGVAVNDFGSQTTDSGLNSEPEVFTLPLNLIVPGVYEFTGVGTGSGPYRVELQ